MKTSIDIVMGVDPGVGGALAVMVGDAPSVFDIPIIKNKVKKAKGKIRTVKEYDLESIYKLLKPFKKNKVLMAVEKVSSRPGEGTVSSFNFGQGFMLWKMAAVCCGFDLMLVRPAEWKKAYPSLSTKSDEVVALKNEIKALRAQRKTAKDSELKQSIKKEIDSRNRRLKSWAKDASRNLAMDLYPDIAHMFKLKKHDGRAESVLIAKYAKEQGKA